ncbi:RNA polymerase sigma-70 factor [marine actinobacterium PHSC20C1]|nr:RNA polymerase sigma-70 factor [marine actinobacterium PHSC20C1]
MEFSWLDVETIVELGHRTAKGVDLRAERSKPIGFVTAEVTDPGDRTGGGC